MALVIDDRDGELLADRVRGYAEDKFTGGIGSRALDHAAFSGEHIHIRSHRSSLQQGWNRIKQRELGRHRWRSFFLPKRHREEKRER